MFEDTFLFHDTVAANIAFAVPDAPFAEIERAARLAGAHDFIGQLPDGYGTLLGERGFSLSGGQRQRVAIARAILADPRVLVLDDATSAVDPSKEHEIRDALTTVLRGRTTIVIAHRAATIALADTVVLLDNGRVAATGTHEGLLATNDRYREVLAAYALHDAEVADEDAVAAEPTDDESIDEEVAADAAADLAEPPSSTPRWCADHVGHGWHHRGGQARPRRQRNVCCGAPRRTPEPYRRESIIAITFITLWTLTTIAGPTFVQRGIDDGIRAGNVARLNLAVAGYIIVTILAYVFGRLQVRAVATAGEGFLRDLRVRVFDHLQSQPMAFYDREQAGVLVTRMTADIDSMGELVQFGLQQFLSAALLIVFTFALLFIYSWQLTLVCMLVVP